MPAGRCLWLVLFAAELSAIDLVLRGPRPAVVASLASVLLWGGLALRAERALPKALLALFSAWLATVQLAFFRHYRTFLDLDAALAARRMWADVAPVVVQHLPRVALLATGLAALHYVVLSSTPKARGRSSLAAVLLGATLLPLASSLDGGALRAASALIRPLEAKAAGGVVVHDLPSRKRTLPHVLFLLTESVRASDYPSDPRDPPATAPETAALLPHRMALRQLRSLGSYTSIAVNALLGGRAPLGSREAIAATPLLFDYAQAVRASGGRPQVHYWSAQTDSLFERSDVRDATDTFVTLDDLVGRKVDGVQDVLEARADALLAARVERDLPALRGPLLLLLHLSGTHAPYYVDPSHAPFQPYRRVATWSGLGELHNAYKNSIVAQDVSVARMIRAFLARAGAEPWLIVLTSDHGEAFGEHKAICHGQNVYDEQIHVPGFIAFGNGALAPHEVEALTAHQDDVVTHLDLLPTLLDAWGVWDSFELTAHRKVLEGQSLLRPFAGTRTPVPLTNCTPLFPCPLRNWGVLGDTHALVSQAWDDGFRCVELRSGREGLSLDEPACARLKQASRALWPLLPSGRPNH